jgi:phospholipase/carboxylesterase
MNPQITRRRFVGLGLAGAGAAFSGMSGLSLAAAPEGEARLRARPGKPKQRAPAGKHPLGLAQGRDGVLSVPPGSSPDKPVPLIVMLHGAVGRQDVEVLCDYAAKAGIAMAMPDSRGRTWDLMLGGFGPDIAFLDRTLEHTFASVAIDPSRIALAGYSDGGTYALSAGLANGDLFTHLIAFSPGYLVPPSRHGKPGIFITHGTADDILPIESTSRRIVPQLKQWGYDVVYKEFPGGHDIRSDYLQESFRWMSATRRSPRS